MANASGAKVVEFKKQKLLKLIDAKVDTILEKIANNAKGNIRSEVPIDTGNLRDSTVVEGVIQVGNKKGINVGTDEDQAPYVRYVYFPAGKHGIPTKTDRPRSYVGNDWITRATQKTNIRLPQIITQAFLDLNNIQI
jgi:hypothetical protein